MNITNKLGLPQPLVAAIANDPYDNAGTLSVTTILKPAQAVALARQHQGEITEDAADRIWSLMGQIGHSIIDRAAPGLDSNRYITERRFFMDMDGVSMPGFDPLRISGAADLIDVPAKTVFDFKFTSGWAVKSARKEGKSDWRYQLSLLAMLAREGRFIHDEGTPLSRGSADCKIIEQLSASKWLVQGPPIDITHGKIVAIVRDWNKYQAVKDRDFPQQPVEVIDMDIMPDDEVREWLAMKLEALKFALGGGDIPCTDEERWAKPGGWAVYKGTNKLAARVMPTEDELSAWIFANPGKVAGGYRIEERPTTYNRCSAYCSAAPFCPQYQQTLEADENDTGLVSFNDTMN